MYLPSYFQQTDLVTLHDFIERHSFGLLISSDKEGQHASHLPLLLDRERGANGELIGHMARANTQWQNSEGAEVLAVFSGPHAYISPTWYEADHVVPTWNYAAVHVHGPFQAIHEPEDLAAIVHAYVEHYERNMPTPWHFDGSPEDGAGSQFVDRLLRQIVGFRIPIERIEGKWKLSQNHPRQRREKVIAALQQQGGEQALQVAAMMQESLDQETRAD